MILRTDSKACNNVVKAISYLVNHAAATPGQGVLRNQMTRLLIEENRWRAKRFGTLGDSDAFVQAKTIIHNGSSADRQLRRYADARSAGLSRQRELIAVVDELMAVTHSGRVL